MPSDTAFPRVNVRSIETRESFTARGKDAGTDRLELTDKIEKLSPGLIRSVLGERDLLVYNLEVRGPLQIPSEMRAKSYVRAKNPFEPYSVDIIESRQVASNKYIISVGVNK